MEALPDEVKEFLATVGMSGGANGNANANAFLASNTSEVAAKYEEWRRRSGRPDLAAGQSAKGVVYSWKQDVTRRQRDDFAAFAAAMAAAHRAVKPPPPTTTARARGALEAKKKKGGTVGPASASAKGTAKPPPPPAATGGGTGPVAPKAKPKPGRSTGGTEAAAAAEEAEEEDGEESNGDSDRNSDGNANGTNDEDLIFSLHDHDVLSGRGGATNQHAGNEWYRRLVRCSAGFYRTCPKHTKLMVAKAVVSAIQKQNPPGRFLEVVDRRNGSYREMSFKRAVEKASQALRERWDPSTVEGASQVGMTRLFNSVVNPGRNGTVSRDTVANAVDLAILRVAAEAASARGEDWFASGVVPPPKPPPPPRPTAAGGTKPRPPAPAPDKRPRGKPSTTNGAAPGLKPPPKPSKGAGGALRREEQRPPRTTNNGDGKGVRAGAGSTNGKGGGGGGSAAREATAPRLKATASGAPKGAAVRKGAAAAAASTQGLVVGVRPNAVVPPVRPTSGKGEDTFGSPVPADYLRPGTKVGTAVAPAPKKAEAAPRAYVAPSITSTFIDLPSSFDTATIASLSPSFDAATEGALSPSFERAASLASEAHADDDDAADRRDGAKRKAGTTTNAGRSKGSGTAATKGKRPRNDSGMSPFHREILKMNLHRIID